MKISIAFEKINKEIKYITNQLKILDANSPMERQRRELLINRLDHLKLSQFFVSKGIKR